MPDSLYQRLMGPAWAHLHESVQRAHLSTGCLRARGVFQVRYGRGWYSAVLARLLGFPPSGAAVPVQLTIIPCATGERWERRFGHTQLTTLQYEAAAEVLAERFGLLELRFQLVIREGGLYYVQQGAGIRLRSVTIPLSLRLAPSVTATESGDERWEHTHVVVEVTLPLLGMLLRYEGDLEVETVTP